MGETTKNKKLKKATNRSDHMANERTFLAWVRTSIAIMAFGFVVEKFTLFIRGLDYAFDKPNTSIVTPHSLGSSTIFGMVLVAMGALIGLLAFVRYKKVEREIFEDTYRPWIMLDVLVAMLILIIGIFLTFYMLHTIS
jgi:putative membrane protein